MVANGAMGLLDCRVMTPDLWAMDHGHGPARQTAPFWLVAAFRKVCCDMEGLLWQKTAQWGLSAARRAFFEPWIEALIALRVTISVSTRHFNSSVEAPLPYFLTKRARFCALGPHCSDSCHLPWDIIKGQGSEETS